MFSAAGCKILGVAIVSWLSTPVAAHDLGLSSAPSRVCDEPGGPFLAKGGIRCSSALGVPVAGKNLPF